MKSITVKGLVVTAAILVLAFVSAVWAQLPGPGVGGGVGVAAISKTEVYSVKFLCGEFSTSLNALEGPVKPGNYQTAINVHNPGASTVTFNKKGLLLFSGVSKFEIPTPPEPFQPPVNLAPDWGLEIDCADIRQVLLATTATPPAPAFIKGFVVIEVPPLLGTTFTQPLDVVAAYTAHGFNTSGGITPPPEEGFSLQVLPVVPKVKL